MFMPTELWNQKQVEVGRLAGIFVGAYEAASLELLQLLKLSENDAGRAELARRRPRLAKQVEGLTGPLLEARLALEATGAALAEVVIAATRPDLAAASPVELPPQLDISDAK